MIIPPVPASPAPDLGFMMGTLVTQVANLGKALEQQNDTTRRNSDEQKEGRKEFLDSLKSLTESIATQTKILQDHIAEDKATLAKLSAIEEWKKDEVQPALKDYTQNKNRATGVWLALGVIGSIVVALCGVVAWVVNTFGQHHA